MNNYKPKMVFITSNEDLVHQISLNKTKSTLIIDLDDEKQLTSIVNNNKNVINWALLARPSELDSDINKVYKRSLELSDDHQLKSVKIKKKSTDLICKICGDRAIGYNYDVLSCASCKAFFQRNAHQNPKVFKCLKGNNQCSIEYQTNRQCFRCRLEKCFAIGMRKDFFRNQSLTIEDSAIIEKIQLSFLSVFENQCEEFVDFIDLTDRASALISWSQFTNQLSLRFIKYFRQLDEFEHLHCDDRFILIKYNLLLLFPILNIYTYKQINDCCSFENHEAAQKKRQFFMLCGHATEMHKIFVNLILYLVEITQQDQILVCLLLIIVLFSQDILMDEDQPLLQNSLSIFHVQSYYTKVLWNYLIYRHGEINGHRQFIQLFTGLLRIQSMAIQWRELLRDQITISDTIDRIAPLMQSVLRIS